MSCLQFSSGRNISLVSKNSTELVFRCVKKLTDTHIPCPVSYLSFLNQTSSQSLKGILFYKLFYIFYSVKCAKN